MISVAATLGDLRRTDKNIFIIAPGIDKMLRADYSNGFSFVICRLASAEVKASPVGYISARSSCNKLFVPTKHGHSGGDKNKRHQADWDHAIFSFGTTKTRGPKPSEMKPPKRHEYIEVRGVDKLAPMIEKLNYVISSANVAIDTSTGKTVTPPRNLKFSHDMSINNLRRLIVSKRQENCDLVFGLTKVGQNKASSGSSGSKLKGKNQIISPKYFGKQNNSRQQNKKGHKNMKVKRKIKKERKAREEEERKQEKKEEIVETPSSSWTAALTNPFYAVATAVGNTFTNVMMNWSSTEQQEKNDV